MLDAFGFTVINEFYANSYVTKNLHRSVSGAVLNGLGIPAATVELGSWLHIDPHIVDAALNGIRNTLRWANMLGGDPEPIDGIPLIDVGFPVRRHYGPHAPAACVVHHLVRVGQFIEPGMPLVRLTDLHGQTIGSDEGLILSEWHGFVIAWQHGVIRYQGEPIMVLAIKDDGDLVVGY
jgi:predicted deacylase